MVKEKKKEKRKAQCVCTERFSHFIKRSCGELNEPPNGRWVKVRIYK